MNKTLVAIATALLAILIICAVASGQPTDTDGDGVLDNVDNCLLVQNPAQRDTNGDGFGNFCDPDLDGNGIVNVIDLGIFKLAFFSNPAAPHWNPDADFNGDNIVNAIDLGRLKLYFFEPPGPVAFAQWNVDADGNWSDPNNWFPVAVPDGDVRVLINRAAPVTVTYDLAAGNRSVIAVNSNNALELAGGILTVTDTIQVNDTFTLTGGGLASGRVLAGNGGQGLATTTFTTSYLDGVTLEADLVITNASSLWVYNGLTLSDASVTLATTDSYAYLVFDATQSQTLGGTGELIFAGSTPFDTGNWVYNNTGTGTLTVGPGITTRSDTAGGLLGWSGSSIIVQGPVLSSLAGRRLTLGGAPLLLAHDVVASGGGELALAGTWTNPATNTVSVTDGVFETAGVWSNPGNIVLTNTPATLGGAFTTADLLNISADSTVSLAGTLDVAALALDTDAAPAGLVVAGGTISGGTVQGSRPLNVSGSGAIDGITLATDLIIGDSSAATVSNGVTLASADIVLASEGSYCYLAFSGTQSVSGSGEILFGGTTTFDNGNWIYANVAGQTVTLEAGVNVRTATSGGFLGWTSSDMTVKGSVISNVPGRTITLAGNVLGIEGPVTGSAGGKLAFNGNWTNATGNTISMNDGDLTLGGNWTNNGAIVVTDGSLGTGVFGSDTWVNNGTINLNNSPATLGGIFASADLLSLTSDSSILVIGEVLNAGQTLDLDALAAANIAFGNAGGITGGTLTGSSAFSVGPNVSITFDGITLETDLTVENGSYLYVENGLTLNAANITLASTGSVAQLYFIGAQSLTGSGEVRFGGTTLSDQANVIELVSGALTIGPNVTVRTSTSAGRIGNASYGLTLQGSVVSDLAGRSIRLEGTPLVIEGSLSIGETASMTSFSANLDLSASAALDIDLGPSGNGSFACSGTANFDGTLNLALVGGLTPTACDLYELIDYGSFSGNFATVNGPDLGGSTFEVLYFAPFASAQTPGNNCQVNLSLLPDVTVLASSAFGPSYVGELVIDGIGNSSWCTANNDPSPVIEVEFDSPVQIDRIQVTTVWSPSYDFLTGTFVARNDVDATVYDSGAVTLTNGAIDLDVVPDTAGVTSLTFSGLTWNSIEPCLSELRILGPMP